MTSFIVSKELIYEKISLSARFNKPTTISPLLNQGTLFQIRKNNLIITATNLVTFFNTSVKIEKKEGEDIDFIIETKKLIDFINYLPSPKIKFSIKEKNIIIEDETNKGVFQKMAANDFPSLPSVQGKEQKFDFSLWQEKLPLILFCASNDDSRPVLTGVYLNSKNDQLVFVATDGFRLSFYSFKKEIDLPPMIVPSSFLEELLRVVKEKETNLGFSQEEKIIYLKTKNDVFISRLIEGEFPSYEKVIPQEKKTGFTLIKEDLLKKLKIISVFTREGANVVILDINDKELLIQPKTEEKNETMARQEIFEFFGDKIRVSFNIRFLIEFLSRFNEEEVVVEILRPDAPVVFKGKKDKNFFHIIMPVRIAE